VAGSVRVVVLVELDLQASAERIGDAAQGGQARDMIAPLDARSWTQSSQASPTALRLACMRPKLKKTVGALGGDQRAVVAYRPGGAIARLPRRSALLN
jgi:hypothetical protein